MSFHAIMVWNFSAISLHPNPSCPLFLLPKSKLCSLSSPLSSSASFRAAAQSEASDGAVNQENLPSFSGSSSSARSQLDFLEQLTSSSSSADGYESDGSPWKLTIRDQLAQLAGDRDDDFSIPLGKNLKKGKLPYGH